MILFLLLATAGHALRFLAEDVGKKLDLVLDVIERTLIACSERNEVVVGRSGQVAHR
jgi:hypothetical protein